MKIILPESYFEIYNSSIQATSNKKISKQCFSDDQILRSNECWLSISSKNIIITVELRNYAANTNFAIEV